MKPPRRASHGVVRLAALDVRRRPGHASELGSQLLMGEVVRLLGKDPGAKWRPVECAADGYRGWVRAWGLVEVTAPEASLWLRLARARVVHAWAGVRERPGRSPTVSPLFWGARVIAGPTVGRYRRVRLPDGRRGWTEARALSVGDRGTASLGARVEELLGIPYLWGGRTPAGMDCSGLVQLLMAERGVPLPRDAGEQERAALPLAPRERPRAGDLVFFGPPRGAAGHVGVLLDRHRFVHARGWVRVNSIEPDNALCDITLYRQMRGVRRPRRPPLGASDGRGRRSRDSC